LPGAASGASAALYLGEIGFDVSTATADCFPEAAAQADLVLTTPELLRRHGRSGLVADAVAAALADPATPADDLVTEGVAEFALSYPLSRSEIYEIGEWLQAARPPRAKAAATRPETLSNFTGARVLVADDSSVNLEVAQSALARFGIAPRTVENGREAVEAHAAAEWDLILMDGSMPELDGFEAAQAIRETERRQSRPRTPIVALTAHVVGAAAEQWRVADMDGVLHKPFTLDRLGPPETCWRIMGLALPKKWLPQKVEALRTEGSERGSAESEQARIGSSGASYAGGVAAARARGTRSAGNDTAPER
jgi:two-component system sensor histidine kinase BarA